VYALTLGVALVYLGEHYVVDLLAGLGLAEGIRHASPRVEPLAERISDAVRAVEARARG
jgi:membrane-associated phospholipid phosphatase